MQNLDIQKIWKSSISIYNNLKLYNTCILPIFLYGSKCSAVTKRDARNIDAVNQWCLHELLVIKWYGTAMCGMTMWHTTQPNNLT